MFPSHDSRFDKSKIGDLYVLVPQKEGSLYPAPYGTYDRKGKSWLACDALKKTQEKLDTTYYNAEKLVSLLNEIYSTESEFSAKSITNARTLKEYFSYNWLISPKQQSKDDDTDTNYWKSRDIAAQDTVFVSAPETIYFNTYLSYQNWKLSNSIELPVYLIEKAKKNYMIDLKSIKIKDETETIWVIREGFYNKKKGVTFIEEDVIC